MFEAQLVPSSILKKIVVALKELLFDTTFVCSGSGIELQGIDNAQVSLVAMNLRSGGFEKYRCDRNISLGINLYSMNNILECAGDDDIVTMKVQDNADTITFVFESVNRKEMISTYEMKLKTFEQIYLGITKTDASIVRMPSSDFARICRNLSRFGDNVVICCTKGGVTFSSAGDMGSGNMKLTQTAIVVKEEEAVIIEMQEPVSLTVSCGYLNCFTKATSLSPVVQMSVSANSPLVVEYKIGDLGYLRYYLAPKGEDDL